MSRVVIGALVSWILGASGYWDAADRSPTGFALGMTLGALVLCFEGFGI